MPKVDEAAVVTVTGERRPMYADEEMEVLNTPMPSLIGFVLGCGVAVVKLAVYDEFWITFVGMWYKFI